MTAETGIPAMANRSRAPPGQPDFHQFAVQRGSFAEVVRGRPWSLAALETKPTTPTVSGPLAS